MRPDVSALKLFYTSPLGRGVSYCLTQKIISHWDDLNNHEVMGLGYTLPIFDHMLSTGAELYNLMPGAQGAAVWPEKSHGRSLLVDEYSLPFADGSLERLIILHALEHAQRPAALIREIWRVLKPGGLVILIAPNRRRAWSASEKTPFGYGTPYSKSQLTALLEDQLLFPTYVGSALMMPPITIPAIESMMRLSEKALKGQLYMLGGLLFIEAEKRVYGTLSMAKQKKQAAGVLSGI